MYDAHDRDEAWAAVVDIIAGSVWAEPAYAPAELRTLCLCRSPSAVAVVLQQWMNNSRAALEVFFNPLTARALDAQDEGIGIYDAIDWRPLERDAVRIIVERLTGI